MALKDDLYIVEPINIGSNKFDSRINTLPHPAFELQSHNLYVVKYADLPVLSKSSQYLYFYYYYIRCLGLQGKYQ